MKSKRISALLIVCLCCASAYFSLIALKALTQAPEIESGAYDEEQGYDLPSRLADLQHQAVNESSGLAASRRNKNTIWTHNDSGDGPFIYAFDRQGKHQGVWRVTGARAQDWEDMALGPGPKGGRIYLYLGDIGDNARKRDEIVVYRVAEPQVSSTSSSSSKQNPLDTDTAEAIRLKYPDGHHDAEALMVHPVTGDLYIITKERSTAAGVYRLKAPFSRSGASVLAHVGEIRLPGALPGFLTGGDISPDGRRAIVCDYFGAYELVLADKRGITFDEIWKQPLAQVSIGTRRQGEAICYRADGAALLATSEGLPCPLIEAARLRRGR